jgi:pimeloyl-ACP methyl ester carboxylesterase
MNIVYIHGNRASAESFNFIRTQLPHHQAILLEYDSEDGFYHNHEKMIDELEGINDIFFVAHSLGGIHALHLTNQAPERVRGGVTLSTPYGGSEIAEFAKYFFPFSQVLKDIHPRSNPIVEAHSFTALPPWTNVVSVRGDSPLIGAANDGVVTRSSMRHRDDIRLVEVQSNHYEVVLSKETLAVIKEAIMEVDDCIV